MIASISLMRRQDAVTQGFFRRHWLDVHGPLVCAFPGLRAYVQCHPIDSPAANRRAREMRADGFPILFFDNDSDRLAAHHSPEMAACNVDSRLFVGAVSRAVSDARVLVPATGPGGFGALAFYADAGAMDADADRMAGLDRLRGLMRYSVREQAGAPNSTVPNLPLAVGAALHARFDRLVDLECALESWPDTAAARFAVEEHWLVGASAG